MADRPTIEYGNDLWRRSRELATVSIPGKRSALYYLNATIRGLKDLVPMTERAHYPLCMFAEGATGIPDIDTARVRLILYPRGVGKSSLITAGLPLLNLLRKDDWASGIANERLDNAKAFLESVKQEFETNDLIRVLFPERVPDDFAGTTWRSDRAVIKRSRPNPVSPSLLAAGVDSTVTGVHMSEWIADDLVSQDAAEQAYRGSFIEIEKTNRWLQRLEPLLQSPGQDQISIIGCIAHDQPVLMADGTWRPIGDVRVGDEVWACRKDGAGGWRARKVTAVWPQGDAGVVEVQVAGRRLVCTPDHPILAAEGRPDGSGRRWASAADLARENAWRPATRGCLVEAFEGFPGIGKSVDRGLYWLLGFLWGDGWVTRCERPNGDETYSVFFALGTREGRNRRAERLLQRYFGGTTYRRGTTVRLDNTEAGRTLEAWGLTPGVRAPGKRLPEWLFRSRREGKRAFLLGLCHADGHRTRARRYSVETASPGLAVDVHRLALTCNVRPTSIYTATRQVQAPNSSEPTESSRNIVSLNFLRSTDTLRRYGVRSVSPLPGKVPVYDLTVEDGYCAFVASGLVVGNTCWWEGDTYDFLQEYYSHGEERREHEWLIHLPSGGTVAIPVYRAGEIAVLRRPIYENGTSFFPERLPDAQLDILRQRDPIFFAGQYLLEPTAGGGSEFDLGWLKTFEWEGPHAVSYRNEVGKTEHTLVRDMLIVVSCDPAFSDKSTAARTAIPCVGVAGNNKFLLEDYAQRGLTVDGIAHKVLDYMVRFRPAKIIIETLVAQIAVADAVRRLARDRGLPEPPIEEIRSHGRQGKQMRIYGLEPYFKRGEFFYHRGQHNFVQEYTSFPRGQLRDLMDALAMQRDYWERAARITDKGHGPGGMIEAANRNILSKIRGRNR